ncbi:DUF4168 domain-containing protein [Alloalcanivorax mobilis]|uniref:DUF4168 domain-containing protein n=1 Tax=Alloalcanivorax mobilis TaxID=2019569 RepID=UPI000B5B0FB0|nr:DUF4168 domain-containing protein [Alloalcanivorax mobilis]ASK33453.1 hypothetical protein CEK62_03150 [Alcanivorax sp. N3-2A]|tara:strand:+ start:75132 stop:75536 length:405 start_codon:yes stop_codon:yes gene_type:complete
MKKRALTLSALLIAASGAAMAQSSPPERQAPTPPQSSNPQARQAPMPQSSDISDDEVEKFAEAQGKVQDIKGSYQEKVQANAKEPEKAMQIQQQAQQEMVQAVKDTGLEVQKYNQIAQLAQYDTDLRERIEDSR